MRVTEKTISAEALEQLVAGHREFVRFVEKRVESKAAAEDIVQAAFVRGLESGAGVPEESAVAWFYRVLRNAIIDHYRHRGATERAAEAWRREAALAEMPQPEVRDEVCGCISALLGGLKPEYQEALRIVDIGERKLSDLAEASGITPENAAVRIHRARKALRRRVEQACGTCAEHGCFDCRCGGGG